MYQTQREPTAQSLPSGNRDELLSVSIESPIETPGPGPHIHRGAGVLKLRRRMYRDVRTEFDGRYQEAYNARFFPTQMYLRGGSQPQYSQPPASTRSHHIDCRRCFSVSSIVTTLEIPPWSTSPCTSVVTLISIRSGGPSVIVL